MSKSKYYVLLNFVLMFFSCTTKSNKTPTVKDSAINQQRKIDTVSYKSITIGNQEWMSENLNSSEFSNGDKIMEAKSNEEWEAAATTQTPAWCYYNNDRSKGAKYGKLYNWYAVNDSRGLAPAGWQIPKNEDWESLINYLGKDSSATMLKSKTDWQTGDGSNTTRFNAYPAGLRIGGLINGNSSYDSCEQAGGECDYWASDYTIDAGVHFYMFDAYNKAEIGGEQKGYGLSVRCFRPITIAVNNNQLNTYKSVKIGNQIWMAENLNVSTFNNGDPITIASNSESCKAFGLADKSSYCYYENNPAIGNIYGKLYNYYAVTDNRGLAPKGWHIPTNAEWDTLQTYLYDRYSSILTADIDKKADDNLISILSSKRYWTDGRNGTNLTGFNALPCGEWDSFFSRFDRIGYDAFFWGVNTSVHFVPQSVNGDAGSIILKNPYREEGNYRAVRCIKDN